MALTRLAIMIEWASGSAGKRAHLYNPRRANGSGAAPGNYNFLHEIFGPRHI